MCGSCAILVWSLTSKQGMYPHGPAPTMVSQSSLPCLWSSWRGSRRDPQSERTPIQMQALPANLHRNQGRPLLPDAQIQMAGSCSGNVAGLRLPTTGYRCAFGIDERTLARWQRESGLQCKRVHEHMVEAGRVELLQVQAPTRSASRP